MAELGRKVSQPAFTFAGRRYTVGDVYAFDDLPPQVRRDVRAQAEDLEARYGRDHRALQFELSLIPHEDLVRVLHERYGDRFGPAIMDDQVVRLARSIERGGLRTPPVGEEGRKRALAIAALGLDMPYFRAVEPMDMPEFVDIPSLDGSAGEQLPEHVARSMREGFWRMMQRISLGLPGFVGTGEITGSPGSWQFTGEMAGIRTGWPLRPHGTRLFETVPVAGFFSLGERWPEILRLIGVFRGKRDNFSKVVERLEKEFGRATDLDLMRGTVPFPQEGPSMGVAQPTRVRPWVRCGNTLFWRFTEIPTADRPVTIHVNPIDLVQVEVHERPGGLPEGAALVVHRALPAQTVLGWSSHDVHEALRGVSPLLAGAVAVWLQLAGEFESRGASRGELIHAFLLMMQPRRNAILSGLEEMLEAGVQGASERRRLIVREGSPAQAGLAEAEAAAGVTDPSVIVPGYDDRAAAAAVDEVLSSYGVVEC